MSDILTWDIQEYGAITVQDGNKAHTSDMQKSIERVALSADPLDFKSVNT